MRRKGAGQYDTYGCGGVCAEGLAPGGARAAFAAALLARRGDFSAVSHGAAALFGVAALVVLLVACRKTPVTVASVSVFGATMILLYTVSTLYHALNVNRAKRVFRVLDHCTIYLLIAGTYTPITLCCLGGMAGLVLLCAVWGAGVLGIVLNAVSLERFKAVSMVCYIAMGWAVVFAMGTVLEKMPAAGLWFLLAGGIAYTVGVAAYGFGKKIPYMHAVWHLFVLLGSVLHTAAVYTIVV